MDGLEIVSRTPFVGRADEVAWLERTLDRARSGRPAIVVLVGEAGIGKTRLLREASRRARRLGFRTLAGCSYEDLRAPFMPFVDALDAAAHELAAISPECREASELLDTIMGRRPSLAAEGIAEDPDTRQLRVLRVLTRSLFAMSRHRPLLVSLDDLHWSDGPSLRLLEHLALRLDDEVSSGVPLPLVVLASARSEEHGPWEVTLARLRGEAAVTTLRVAGLRGGDVSSLLRDGHGLDLAPVVVRRLMSMTRGNPLHLEALVANLDKQQLAAMDELELRGAPVPATIGAVIAESLRRLPAMARQVMEVVAVTNGEADAALVAAVLEVDLSDVQAGIAVAVEAGALTGTTEIDFSHPVQRHVCLAELSRTRLESLHAKVLAALQSRSEEIPPERLARHALGAGDAVDPAARARWAIDAGTRRRVATDWAAAAELFDAARSLGPEVLDSPLEVADLELNAALCHSWTGLIDDLDVRLRTAARWYAEAGSTAGVALSHLALVRARIDTGAWGEPIDVSELEGQVDVLAVDHPQLAALVQADLALALWAGGRSEEAVEVGRLAVEMGTAADSHEATARGYTVLGVSHLTLLEFGESRDALERGLAVAEASGDLLLELALLIRLPLTTGMMGDTRACQAYTDRALELCGLLHESHDAEFPLATLCNLAGARGDFIAVEQTGAEVRSIARLTGSPWTEPFALAAMAAARAMQGDADAALEAIEATLPSDPAMASWAADMPTHRVMVGYLAALRGDLERAAERVTKGVVEDLLVQPAVLGNGSFLAAIVEVARALDEPALAEAVLPSLRDLHRRGQVLTAGMPFLLARSIGLAHRLSGRVDEARAMLEAALAVAQREGLRVEELRVLLDLADLATDQGDHRAATDRREEAAAGIEALGMWGLATRAGVRPMLKAVPVVNDLPPAMASGQAVVLFADISGSTRINEQLGDLAFRYRSRKAEAAMRAAVAASGGRAIEGIRLGDGILAEFPTTRGAVTAALIMIGEVDACGLEVHVGVHQGEVIRDDLSIFGSAVNLAARICDQALPSQLLVSEGVAVTIAELANLVVTDAGARPLKGIDRPPRLFAVTAAPDAEPSAFAHPTHKE